MVMTASSWMAIGETNDRTTKGVRWRSGNGLAMKGGRAGERVVVSRAFVTASLSLLIARH
jgi:hypothetical protein